MHNFAPVLIPTLNRHMHFKRCVESLSVCTHADKTDLYIFLDYPLKDSHWEGYELIKAYLPNIKGFKTVNVIEREKNYGAVDNIFKSLEYVLERHDRLIFSEDDNEFSPNFLDYINKGLDRFEDDENVLAVSGYCQPIKIPKNYDGNYHYQRRLAAWGFGTWKKKWKSFNYSIEELISYTKKCANALKLYKRSQIHLVSVLEAIKYRTDFYGDVAVGFYMTMNENVRCINPTISKVRNHGHDGTGVHCGSMQSDVYKIQEIDNEKEFKFIDATRNDYLIQKELRKFFGLSIKGKIKALKAYVCFKLKHF